MLAGVFRFATDALLESRTMSDAVREIVMRHLPPGRVDSLRDDLSLTGDELGLDSIAVAEVLLELEDRFGVRLAALLESGPITIGDVREHLARAPR